jgi:trk system potassium uptake protein TrkH
MLLAAIYSKGGKTFCVMRRHIRNLNYRIIIHIMGLLFAVNGGFMLIATLVSFAYRDGVGFQMLLAGIVTILLGGITMLLSKNHRKEIQKREGYIIVTFGWIFMSLAGTLPYVFTGAIDGFTNIFFETISGYTTTGASILSDVESLPKGILFWRSITHWIGGMGIIVLAIAILPLLGIGGMQLFAAEAPGPGGDKLHPRITDTAKRLWLIYVGYTIAETILLQVAGMSFFDAINHSLSTLSTGGFSTKNNSVAYWNDSPLIQYIIIVFMFLAGTNFVLSYFAFKRKFSRIFRDEEFRVYLYGVISLTIVAALFIYAYADVQASSVAHPLVYGEFEGAVRHGLFQVLAIVTTTGFVTADYTMWAPFLTIFFFGLMFLGASSGSTSGGIKIVRHLLMIKNGVLEFKRTLHPNAILPVRYNNKAVQAPIVYNILGFFILYMLSFIVGVLVFSWLGLDFRTALGGAASSLGNVGPALGNLGPVDTYESLPALAKWWACFLMLIGRLELFTVLILLTPFFWRNR